VALNGPTIVILRALGLGDLLTAVPALRAVADAYPVHHRVLATSLPLIDLAARIGAVDEVVAVQPLAPLPHWLSDADLAVNLHGRGPQSHRVLLDARPKRLLAFANEDAGVAGPIWRPDEHEVHRWCRLLQESGIAADPSRLTLDPGCWPAPQLPPSPSVVHPGAASPARRWPADRWAAVAAAEAAAGHTVVVTGGAAEAERCRDITASAGLPPAACLAGRTDLPVLAGVVAAAGMVVCGDTGVAHLATAFGRASVVLFGPIPPSEWGPPRDQGRHVALWPGRRGDPHADTVAPGLLDITVPDVLDAIRQARAAGHSPSRGATSLR
jgi:ADP-heptose:LPS heptosyltransferase